MLGLIPTGAAIAASLPGVAMCSACNQLKRQASARFGPDLSGIAGPKAGTQLGYGYSPGMRASRIVWTKETLSAFLADPRKTAPGTRMAYPAQKDPAEVAAIATYILSLP
jgi:cytochrome c